ncbi:MAG: aminotransferase class I/II-fold pyridoxal phosphate-dependent enzyme [Bacteroidota bacterium]
MLWPLKEASDAGCYFYNVPIERHISTTEVEVREKGRMLMFGGYSYLSLHNHPYIKEAIKKAVDICGSGVQGARLLAGTADMHKILEKKISAFKGTDDTITYSSGYIANVSSISSLVGRNDTIFSDKLNHASIIDGCMLSKARLRKFRHNDMEHLEKLLKQENKGRLLVIVDAVFSMDGDIIDLPKLSWLCKRYRALLMVDECHSLGVIGKTGKGIEEHFNLPTDSIDIKMGTLGKSIPSQGGYIASSDKICTYLRHQSRGFIYTGANAPTNDAASIAALEIIENEPERVEKLHHNISYAKSKLLEVAFQC